MTQCYVCRVITSVFPGTVIRPVWETLTQPSRAGQRCQAAGTLWSTSQATSQTQGQVRVDPRPHRREEGPPTSHWAGAAQPPAWPRPGHSVPLNGTLTLIRDTGQSCGQTSEPTASYQVTTAHHQNQIQLVKLTENDYVNHY